EHFPTQHCCTGLLALSLACAAGGALALTPAMQDAPDARDAPSAQPAAAAASKPKLDLSGRKRVGKASFYAHKFAGRKMADGCPTARSSPARPRPTRRARPASDGPAMLPELLGAQDRYLFREGTHARLYERLGCQLLPDDAVARFAGDGAARFAGHGGARFAVW